MRRVLFFMLSTFGLIALVTGALGGCGSSVASAAQTATLIPTAHFVVNLQPVNASGVSGTAQIDVTGQKLTVTIHASGLEPNKEHYQHIHGNSGVTVVCPAGGNTGGSDVITVDEGLAAVGPIAWDLAPYAQVGDAGSIEWSRSYTLTSSQFASLAPLVGHVIVLHGMTYRGVYDRALFVACGAIQPA